MLTLTALLFGVFLVLIIAYLLYIRRGYDFFKNLNIPGPKPVLFFGNFLEVVRSRRFAATLHKWTEQYGQIYGYFEGHTPILVVSDPDILQDIFIKSFSNFHSRRPFAFEDPNARDVNLFSATGLRWKRQRFIINPTFSSAKLKQMTPLMHRTLTKLMTKIDEEYHMNAPFDIYAYFKRYTMDSIWSCGFGIDTDMQNNSNNPYLIHSQYIFIDKIHFDVIIALLVTECKRVWIALDRFAGVARYWLRNHFPFTKQLLEENPIVWITKEAKTLIDARLKIGQTNRINLLQLMLESASDEDFIQVLSFEMRCEELAII
jgi:cytochrome P450